MRKSREKYSGKSERVQGDALIYFCVHNLISVIFFFVLTICFEVYVGKDRLIGFIFQKEFWEMVIFQVFPILIISSFIGRITAYFLINGYYSYLNRKRRAKRSTKRWNEFNAGINRIGVAFFITALATALIYSLGLVAILQFTIFNEETLLTLIITYILIKVGVFMLVRWLVGAKL